MSDKLPEKGKNSVKVTKDGVVLLMLTIVVSVIVVGVYRVLLDTFILDFQYVLFTYMAIETAFVVAYLMYNRGFSRKGVTVDMLPAEWTEEKKAEFIEDGRRRQRSSRWMLIFIIAFMLPFVVDIFELYVIPTIKEMFA